MTEILFILDEKFLSKRKTIGKPVEVVALNNKDCWVESAAPDNTYMLAEGKSYKLLFQCL